MRRRLVALTLALAASAHGDEILPSTDPNVVAAVPARGALRYRAAAHLGSEHGCSQSFESQARTARLELTVDEAGRATLTVEADRSSTFGPSESRYLGGDHHVEHEDHPEAPVRWTGTARRRPDGLDLDLRSGGATLTLACRIRPVVVESYANGSFRTGRVPALVCDNGSKLIGDLGDLSIVQVTFGNGAGFDAHLQRRDFEYHPQVHLWRAD